MFLSSHQPTERFAFQLDCISLNRHSLITMDNFISTDSSTMSLSLRLWCFKRRGFVRVHYHVEIIIVVAP